MRRHWNRSVIYVVGDEQPIEEPQYLSFGSPAAPASDEKVYLRFGRMFERRDLLDPAEHQAMVDKLIALGKRMTGPPHSTQPADEALGDSDIPSGYTYLGQFIAHEITFHETKELPTDSQPLPVNMRSPQIDLDSLYGAGPKDTEDSVLYEKDGARLKVGVTTPIQGVANWPYPNDLPRAGRNAENPKKALIGDPRNDENLPLAQTHLAFIKFHNKVVEVLEASNCPSWKLFESARRLVIQHFQWIILEDYLPRLVDACVLRRVRSCPRLWFKEDEPFMPVEFSAAAFRVGHSMVRGSYNWNSYHSARPFEGQPTKLENLFEFTNFSGSLGGESSLPSDWVINWRHFYDFDDLPHIPFMEKQYRNKARKIDTMFNLRLHEMPGYPHGGLENHLREITVRNLLRGFSFGLPSGEEVAGWLEETPLSPHEVAQGPHEGVLSDPAFRGRTPLWYYILKEAELLNDGNRLGPVGSRIIAETFVSLIKKSRFSILKDPCWRPMFGRPQPGSNSLRFEMADLLDFADVVDPIGDHLSEIKKKP